MDIRFVSFVASTMLLSGGVAARPVAPPSALAAWVGGVEAKISRSGAEMMLPMFTPDRAATVRFVRGNDGRAADIAIERSSGSAAFDAHVRRSVQALAGLDPLPDGFAPGTPIRVRLVFAEPR